MHQAYLSTYSIYILIAGGSMSSDNIDAGGLFVILCSSGQLGPEKEYLILSPF